MKDHDPCSESARRNESWGNAIAGGIAGALVGALAGALIAKALKTDARTGARRGAMVGLGAGVIGGYNRGVDSFRRQCEIYKLARERSSKMAFATLNIGKDAAGEVVVNIDQGHFVPGTSELTPTGKLHFEALARNYSHEVQLKSFEQSAREVAKTKTDPNEAQRYTVPSDEREVLLKKWASTRIIITGHTDDQFDLASAQITSENRAKVVAEVFRDQGVPDSTLLYQGAGASLPIADNREFWGRAQNNRVEVILLYEDALVEKYLESRRSNQQYFSERDAKATKGPSTISTTGSKAADSDASKVAAPSGAAGKTAKQATATEPKLQVAPKQVAKAAPSKNKQSQIATTPKAEPLAVSKPLEPGLEFGGSELGTTIPSVASRIGAVKAPPKGFSLDSFSSLLGVGNAYASGQVIPSCHQDDYRRYQSGEVKGLVSNSIRTRGRAPIAVADSYLFSTVRAVIHGPVGDHHVEISDLTIKKSGELAEPPKFNIYLGFHKLSEEQRRLATTPSLSVSPVSTTVVGESGLLLRQFLAGEKGLVCADFVIPNDQRTKKIEAAQLIYEQSGRRKVVAMNLER